MAKETKAAEKQEAAVTLETLNSKVNWMAAGLRILEKALKEQFGMNLDLNADGKKGGHARVFLLVAILAASLCASLVKAELLWTPVLNTTYGTCRVDSASGACTLTVDAVTSSGLTTTTTGVSGNFRIGTNLIVVGTSTLTGAVTCVANASVGGALNVTGAVTGSTYSATGAFVTNSFVKSIILVSATQATYVVQGIIMQGNVYYGVTGLTTNSTSY